MTHFIDDFSIAEADLIRIIIREITLERYNRDVTLKMTCLDAKNHMI